MAQGPNSVELRAEHIDSMVKGFALLDYVFKDALSIESSSSWIETYYDETAADPTAPESVNQPIKGVPRGANFPHIQHSWTKKLSYMEKYAAEGVITIEDERTSNIGVMKRSLLRISRAVASQVDAQIWAVLSESQSASNINSVAISGGNEWDSATVANRDPVKDILQAKQKIKENNYDAEGAILFLSPKDETNLLSNSKISNNSSFRASDVISNGKVGTVLGVNLRVSNNVTADYALLCVPQMCATWKSVMPLTVETIVDAGIKKTIRAWEMGVTQLTNPKAVTLISNTQA